MQLDGNLIKENGHDYLAEALDFPDYYGKNLDALHGLLAAVSIYLALGNLYAIKEGDGIMESINVGDGKVLVFQEP